MVLGITGGIGSGKSVVSSILKNDYGYTFLSADDMAKDLMMEEDCKEALSLAFGNRIFNTDGTINKQVYADMIFNDESMRDLSDSIVHSIVAKRIESVIRDSYNNASSNAVSKRPNIVIETAVIYKGFRNQCDQIWYIYSDRDTRIKRLMENRAYSLDKCESILSSQASDEYYRSVSDKEINNNKGLEDLKIQVGEYL